MLRSMSVGRFSPNLHTEGNFWYGRIIENPDLFFQIYGTNWTLTPDADQRSVWIDTMIVHNQAVRVITFRFNDGTEIWMNLSEHELILQFIAQIPSAHDVSGGFIVGTQAPARNAVGMMSANMEEGYQFWFKGLV